jgi:hypothetical protein
LSSGGQDLFSCNQSQLSNVNQTAPMFISITRMCGRIADISDRIEKKNRNEVQHHYFAFFFGGRKGNERRSGRFDCPNPKCVAQIRNAAFCVVLVERRDYFVGGLLLIKHKTTVAIKLVSDFTTLS